MSRLRRVLDTKAHASIHTVLDVATSTLTISRRVKDRYNLVRSPCRHVAMEPRVVSRSAPRSKLRRNRQIEMLIRKTLPPADDEDVRCWKSSEPACFRRTSFWLCI